MLTTSSSWGGTKRNITSAFSAIDLEAADIGLVVNEGEIKCMSTTSRNTQRIGFQIMAGSYSFDVVNDFVYVCSLVTEKNYIILSR